MASPICTGILTIYLLAFVPFTISRGLFASIVTELGNDTVVLTGVRSI